MKLPKDIEAKCLELAGEKPKPRRKVREVALPGVRPRWAITLYPACRVVTEANTHEHWTVKDRRRKAQKAAVIAAWLAMPVRSVDFGRSLPVVVTLTHSGPRMDDDNLQRAFKAIRDETAWVIGVDDGDDRVSWRYEQRPGEPGVEIRIEPRE